MEIITVPQAMRIVGLELRTSNERAFEDIPKHWQRFQQNGALAAISNRVSDDVYAVYTNFEHPGVDNRGVYSLIIGAHCHVTHVTDAPEVPAGMAQTVIAGSRRAVFPVDRGHHEKVGARWQEIWANTDITRTYVCDYERYQASGEIDIFVGIS